MIEWGKLMSTNCCYVIVLNYQNSDDTIECLESLYDQKKTNYKIIVVDNNSKDESVTNIVSWIDQQSTYRLYRIYEEGALADTIDSFFTIVKAKKNRGFGAGNNIGLRLAVKQKDCGLMFILNNDTVVEENLLYRAMLETRNHPKAGIFSVKVISYFDRKTVQFYNQLKLCVPIAKTVKKEAQLFNAGEFYSGSGFFVTPKFIEQVGYMDERYFLYYEELDWVEKAKKHSFEIVYLNDLVLYHKWNATTSKTSRLAAFCYTRSALLFTKIHHPFFLPTVVLFQLLRSFYYVLTHRTREALVIVKAIWFFLCVREDRQIEVFLSNG